MSGQRGRGTVPTSDSLKLDETKRISSQVTEPQRQTAMNLELDHVFNPAHPTLTLASRRVCSSAVLFLCRGGSSEVPDPESSMGGT